jgi:hypothetical protein
VYTNRSLCVYVGLCYCCLTVFLFHCHVQIGQVLTGHLTDTPEELIEELSEYLHR